MILFGNILIGIGQLLGMILNFAALFVLVSCVLSWFQVNQYNPVVRYINSISYELYRIPRRYFRTVFGQFDLAPLILIFAIYFLQTVVASSLFEYGIWIKSQGLMNSGYSQQIPETNRDRVRGRSL